MTHSSYIKFREKIELGDTTCVDVTRSFLERIHENNSLNAFLGVREEEAIAEARQVDEKIAAGKGGKLAGMVVALKDIFNLKGHNSTCGSKILQPYVSPYNATIVDKMLSEDAIIIGKTNMDEFGMGSSNENSAYGPVKNPRNPEYIPGGSSGGSAAAVAASLAHTAIGSDTGGSVRQPAALTGIVGLRPTYGRISRYGLIAFASSLDTVGLFSQTVADNAILLETLAGFDEKDSTSSREPVKNYSELMNRSLEGMTFGLPKEYFGEGLDPEIRSKIEQVVEAIEKEGGKTREVSLSMTDYGIATYYLICTAEASSNLARYDGVKYGIRKKGYGDLISMYENTRHDGFGDEVKRRIMLGTYVLSAGYYDAYYKKAQQVRTLIRDDFNEAFENCDVLLGPTTPDTAFKLGEKNDDPMAMYLSDIYTVTAPLAGLPALSIPVGHDKKGLPIGLQITGKQFHEGDLYRVAQWIEQNHS